MFTNLSDKSKRSLSVFLIIFTLSAISVAGIVMQPVHAVGSYNNADIATKAESYWNGKNGAGSASGSKACDDAHAAGYTDDSGGQCRAFVNCVVFLVGGQRIGGGGSDYYWGFLHAGGQEITNVSNLARGDIVQSGSGDHTFIISSVLSFNSQTNTADTIVVDSNHYAAPYANPSYPETVSKYERSITLDSYSRAFRMGTRVPAPNSSTPGLGGGGASSWTSGRLDAWIEQASSSGTSNLGHIWYDIPSGWHAWETIPGNQLMTSQPAVVSWGVNRVDVFARGQAGDLIHEWLDSGTWHGWESFGGCIVGAPTVTSWAPGRLDVMVEGCNTTGSNLYHIWYANNAWKPWELISANQMMYSSPSAVSWGSGRIDLFSQGASGNLIHAWYDSNGWHAWESLGGCIIGSPAASSWGYGRLDGWVEGCNTTGSNFFHIWYDIPSGWHPFEAIPSNVQIAGVLGVVSWAFGRIDMFTRNSDNSVAHWWYDGAWRGPESKGGVIASD